MQILFFMIMLSLLQGVEYAEQSERWETDSQAGIAAAREESNILQSTLQELASCIIEDTENTARLIGSYKFDRDLGDEDDSDVELSASTPAIKSKSNRRSGSPSRMARMRSMSPVRARSPAHTDYSISAAQSALKKRLLQVQVGFL